MKLNSNVRVLCIAYAILAAANAVSGSGKVLTYVNNVRECYEEGEYGTHFLEANCLARVYSFSEDPYVSFYVDQEMGDVHQKVSHAYHGNWLPAAQRVTAYYSQGYPTHCYNVTDFTNWMASQGCEWAVAAVYDDLPYVMATMDSTTHNLTRTTASHSGYVYASW